MHALVMRRSEFGFFFPLITKLVEICLSAPINNAWPERGIKRLKTRPKNRIKNMLNSLSACSYPWLFTPAPSAYLKAPVAPTTGKHKRRPLEFPQWSPRNPVHDCKWEMQQIKEMFHSADEDSWLDRWHYLLRIFLKFWSWIVLLVLICMVCICSHAFQMMVENMPHLANNVTRCYVMPCHAMYATTAC